MVKGRTQLFSSLRRTSKSMGLLLSWRPTSPPLTSILWPLFFCTSPRMVFTSLSDRHDPGRHFHVSLSDSRDPAHLSKNTEQ